MRPLAPIPVNVRLALLLVYAFIGYRIFLLASSAQGVIADGELVRPPGRLGMPLLVPLLLVTMIVVRRLLRSGYNWARHTYAAIGLLRLGVLAIRDFADPRAGVLAALLLGSIALLYTPSANRWFELRGSPLTDS